MEFIRDELEATEDQINQALGEEDTERKPAAPSLTPEQLKTKRIFEEYDGNSDELLSWPEWEEYVRKESEMYDSTKEEDVSFWMNQRMEFNFIDFNRDDNLNKEEFEYWLNNPVNLSVQENLISKSNDQINLVSQEFKSDVKQDSEV